MACTHSGGPVPVPPPGGPVPVPDCQYIDGTMGRKISTTLLKDLAGRSLTNLGGLGSA